MNSVSANGHLDFSDPDAVRQLTKSLLKRDFGLEVELPEDRLCPPSKHWLEIVQLVDPVSVTSEKDRLNYILWLQDLLHETRQDGFGGEPIRDENRPVKGLDVGTGASCIYPLLGCATSPGWKFTATEIDGRNYESATRNVKLNDLESRITVLKKTDSDPLLSLDGSLDFTMCNPPFYASERELIQLASKKSRPPFSACTGAPVEMIYAPNGEVSFIQRIVEESTRPPARQQVQWFTVMCGKLDSVGVVLEMLQDKECKNWAVREFVTGKDEEGQRVGEAGEDAKEKEDGEERVRRTKTAGTRRWGVAWSWMTWRAGMDTSRNHITPKIPRHLLPFPSEYTFTYTPPSPHSPQDDSAGSSTIFNRIKDDLSKLDMAWTWNPDSTSGIGWSTGDVWSRKARRMRMMKKRKREDDEEGTSKPDQGKKEEEKLGPGSASFGVRISICECPQEREKLGEEQGGQARSNAKLEVKIRWLKGDDTVLFESFCGMVKRKVEEGRG
ncbi:hypothetical protein KEM55_006094 [Ascosphaera atra]|nr:hypothetical protein KEM55_006094 [Ascosphaera atra]